MIHENLVKTHVQINKNANSKRIFHHCGGVRNKRDSAILRNSLPNRVIYQAWNYLPCGQKLFELAFQCFNLEIPVFNLKILFKQLHFRRNFLFQPIFKKKTIVWVKMNNTGKWLFYNHFWPFFCQLYGYLSQNWGSDGHFDVLNGSKF